MVYDETQTLNPPTDAHPSPRLRQLWQVPAFLMGIGALVIVVIVRPLSSDRDGRRFERQLQQLRSALSESVIEWKQSLAQEEEIVARAECFPDRAGTAHFLLGSTYLNLGETAGAIEAPNYRTAARRHLERAAGLGVSDDDGRLLSYRLARCWHLAGENPHGVIAALTPIANEGFAEAARAYTMLARAYLSLPVGDVEQALRYNSKLLALPTVNEELLAPARLLQGELLARLDRLTEARQVLARVGKDAPVLVRVQARTLRAQLCQRQGDWTEALEHWKKALADPSAPPDNSSQIRFELGRCHRELNQIVEAEAAWIKLLPAGGDVAQAAALELGALLLERDPAGAVRYFERALREIADPGQYRNPLLDLGAARDRLKNACVRLGDQRDFSRALQLVKPYEKLTSVVEGLQLQGQMEETWAKALRAKNDAGAAAHFLEAGAAYTAVAAALPVNAERAGWRRRAAAMYQDGHEDVKCVELLKLYIAEESVPEACGAGQFELAEAHRRLGRQPEAEAAYRACIEWPGTAAFRARFRLAEFHVARGELEDAKSNLTQALDLMRQSPAAEEDPLYSQVLFTLADVHFSKKDYLQARTCYSDGLQRAGPLASVSLQRFRFAEACRLQAEDAKAAPKIEPTLDAASRAAIQQHRADQYQRLMDEAIKAYEELCTDLVGRRMEARLPDQDEAILLQADFQLAKCLFVLGKPQAARERYEALAVRYQSRADALGALHGQYLCWRKESSPEASKRAGQVLQKIAELLNALPDDAIPDNAAQWRQSWNGWLKEQLKGIEHAGP